MSHRSHRLSGRNATAATLLLGAVLAWSADGDFEKYTPLIRRNPFASKSGAGSIVSKPSATGAYRFTGLVVIGNKTLVGIENVAGNRSYLLPVGQETDGLVVKEVEAKEKRVTLAANGETMTLPLVDTSVALASAQPAPASGPASPSGSIAGATAPRPAASSPIVSTVSVGSIAIQTSSVSRARRIIVPKRN